MQAKQNSTVIKRQGPGFSLATMNVAPANLKGK